jgi:ABC-2 type transport system ATP-binding protein
VDHGELKALDSPMRLKAAVPGQNTLDASFSGMPADWRSRLERLPGVERVTEDGPVFRLTSSSGPATTMALMAAASDAGVAVDSLGVQSTSLDDVFVHYTGHQLRDALQEPSAADRHIMLRR